MRFSLHRLSTKRISESAAESKPPNTCRSWRTMVAYLGSGLRWRKNALGLGDFRQQSLEATQKWFAVILLAINYLNYRWALADRKNLSRTSLADFIRQHRLEHFRYLLRTVLQPFAPAQQIETYLQHVFSVSPWAIVRC